MTIRNRVSFIFDTDPSQIFDFFTYLFPSQYVRPLLDMAKRTLSESLTCERQKRVERL